LINVIFMAVRNEGLRQSSPTMLVGRRITSNELAVIDCGELRR
jgi:hypothetical protein